MIEQFQTLSVNGLTGQLSWAASGEVTKTPNVYVIKDAKYVKVD